MARLPVAEGLFTWPSDEPRLIGSRCAACGIVTFPAQDSCPRCASTEMGEHLLARADGELEIGGRLPVNTDGGLIANGEPIGASGLRQVHEVVLQLRGRAGDRQVPGEPKVGYTQLYGAPGVAGVSILSV